jgi:predicted anti-sigma-YlaC factor YlaD
LKNNINGLDMTDHNQIRSLLPLQVAGGINREEQTWIDDHLRECSDCRSELASLRSLAADLKSIPEPQPSFGLAQRTRARIAAEMAAKAERRQQQRFLASIIGFAWIVTVLTFVIGRFLITDVALWVGISPETCMRVFISYTIFAGTASVAFSGLLARRHRDERRLI